LCRGPPAAPGRRPPLHNCGEIPLAPSGAKPPPGPANASAGHLDNRRRVGHPTDAGGATQMAGVTHSTRISAGAFPPSAPLGRRHLPPVPQMDVFGAVRCCATTLHPSGLATAMHAARRLEFTTQIEAKSRRPPSSLSPIGFLVGHAVQQGRVDPCRRGSMARASMTGSGQKRDVEATCAACSNHRCCTSVVVVCWSACRSGNYSGQAEKTAPTTKGAAGA
jgi:hypothetical protein